ncbi:MAG: thioredoxin domain-containing protein [Planctomycetes bacterium]|nr:thioredoxin domain-containing protein [Planctomycetota bacterium]
MREAYGDKVRIVFRDLALAMHNRAQPAAEAAQCARDQGKFWEYHDKIFQNQQKLADEDLKRYATELGLDAEAFNACFDSGKFRADVQKDGADAQAVGVSGTPAFFINGRFLSGAQPFEAFKVIIDEEIER